MALGGSLGGVSLCSFGTVPVPVNMPPIHMVMGPSGPFNNMMDKNPIMNIPSYAVCTVPVPKPCVPSVPGPWLAPIPTIMIGNSPVFDNSAKAICALGGIVSIMAPTQPKVFFT